MLMPDFNRYYRLILPNIDRPSDSRNSSATPMNRRSETDATTGRGKISSVIDRRYNLSLTALQPVIHNLDGHAGRPIRSCRKDGPDGAPVAQDGGARFAFHGGGQGKSQLDHSVLTQGFGSAEEQAGLADVFRAAFPPSFLVSYAVTHGHFDLESL